MTIKQLQHTIEALEGYTVNPLLDNLLERLKHRQFWCGIENNGFQDCCFNHIIGLPEKQGVPKLMFDYEQLLLSQLLSHGPIAIQDKHLFIKKATGLGITEFCLRFMAWLCCHDDTYRNTQMVIVTGPSIEIAIKLIKRIKALFERHDCYFDFKENYFELNGVQIEAFPSHHLDTFRALESPSLILLDEADFFPFL